MYMGDASIPKGVLDYFAAGLAGFSNPDMPDGYFENGAFGYNPVRSSRATVTFKGMAGLPTLSFRLDADVASVAVQAAGAYPALAKWLSDNYGWPQGFTPGVTPQPYAAPPAAQSLQTIAAAMAIMAQRQAQGVAPPAPITITNVNNPGGVSTAAVAATVQPQGVSTAIQQPIIAQNTIPAIQAAAKPAVPNELPDYVNGASYLRPPMAADAGQGNVVAVSNPPPANLLADWASFWAKTPAGSQSSWTAPDGSGSYVLVRNPDGTATISSGGNSTTFSAQTDPATLATNVPIVAKAWSYVYGWPAASPAGGVSAQQGGFMGLSTMTLVAIGAAAFFLLRR